MFARIGDVIPRFKTYERLFSIHERLVDALSIAYLDIITFYTNAKAVFRPGEPASSRSSEANESSALWRSCFTLIYVNLVLIRPVKESCTHLTCRE